jgi:hypothetical protein
LINLLFLSIIFYKKADYKAEKGEDKSRNDRRCKTLYIKTFYHRAGQPQHETVDHHVNKPNVRKLRGRVSITIIGLITALTMPRTRDPKAAPRKVTSKPLIA